jgi:hypothetical protein
MNMQLQSMAEVRRLSNSALSLKARLGYVALLLLAIGITTVIGSLWATEPSLPVRTHMAFGAMCLIGVSWVALAVWVLRARRPLYARDRVIAGGMAVTFTSLFLAGAVAAVVIANNAAAYAVLVTGAVLWAVAIRVLVSARRRFAELSQRRAALET